jgi:hypothetical protein
MLCCPDCGAELVETPESEAMLRFVCPWSCPTCGLCCHEEEAVECG